MRGVTAIALGAVLLAFFLVLVAAMVWQEARRRPDSEPPVYALEEAASFVHDRLPASATLGRDDVLRILEWQVFFLQESVRGVEAGEGEVVVGVTSEAVDYIEERTRTVQQKRYARAEIEMVLAGQGGYLASIGAVAEPVQAGEEET